MPSQPRDHGLHAVRVWDLPTRLFHWVNALAVLVLIGDGLIVMNLGALGIRPPGALVFKQIHVWVGYVLAVNLALRVLWAFFGPTNARWRALLPSDDHFWRSVRTEAAALIAGRPKVHAAHSEGGKLAILIMLGLLALLTITGLVLAGTDIYYPPFGHYFAAWVAAPGVDPAHVVPYEPNLVTLSAFYEVRDFRRPFIFLHEWGFYALSGMVLLHVASVVLLEVRGGGVLVSAMITGVKILPRANGASAHQSTVPSTAPSND